MKCVGMQHLDAVRQLKQSNHKPIRSIYILFSPDEGTGGHDGAEKLPGLRVFFQEDECGCCSG